jgi:hypothetical protein
MTSRNVYTSADLPFLELPITNKALLDVWANQFSVYRDHLRKYAVPVFIDPYFNSMRN